MTERLWCSTRFSADSESGLATDIHCALSVVPGRSISSASLGIRGRENLQPDGSARFLVGLGLRAGDAAPLGALTRVGERSISP